MATTAHEVVSAPSQLVQHSRSSIAASLTVPPPDWDDEVLEAGGTLFHSSAMGAAALAHGHQAWYLRLVHEGRTAALAVAAGIRPHSHFFGRRGNTLEFPTKPQLIGTTDWTLRDAVDAIREFAKDKGFRRISFLSYADVEPDEALTLRSAGLTLTPRLEFRVPLEACPVATVAAMHAGHRQKVHKAMRSGFEFVEDSSLVGAMALRELQDVTYGRQHERGNHDAHAWSIADYRVVMSAYLAQHAIRFWFVKRNGRTLSGAGLMLSGRRAYYLLAGTNREGYTCDAAYAVVGHLVPVLVAAGVRELNFGGMAVGTDAEDHIEHGLYRFKTGFGAQVVTCYSATGST